MNYRIIDANINRVNEGLRCIEEYTRFVLNNEEITTKLKNIRHEISIYYNKYYENLISARNTTSDVGTNIKNIFKETNSSDVIIANLKRIQEGLRVLTEYSGLDEKYRYQTYTIEKEIMEIISKNKCTNIKQTLLKDKNIYLITSSDNFNSGDEFLDKIAQILKCGVKIIQYREKNKPAKEIIKTGMKIRQLCSIYGALFIVNDRIDIAKILDADGVHLGQDDIPINEARKILGNDKIIGISTHKPNDALEAQKAGADYIGVGPVFKTPTKPNATPVGLEYVKWVSKNIKIPFYAIGSIDINNVQKVLSAGANRIAVIRALMNAQNPDIIIKKFMEEINNGK